jgi:hypothetical protein
MGCRHFIIVFFLFLGLTLYGQVSEPFKVNYGAGISVSHSGSGHGTNMVFSILTQNNFKGMEFGVSFSPENMKLKGGEFKYKAFTGKFDHYFGNTLFRPYFVYDFMYNMEKSFEPDVFYYKDEAFYMEDPDGGKIATMEHYAGMGMHMMFSNKFFIESSLGLGAYLGSISKLSDPGWLGFHEVNHGFTTTMKFSMGIMLN